jgi:hypothetical protein
MIIEGIIVSKETGLTASFDGKQQPYVKCVVARRAHPEVRSEARIIGQTDIAQEIGDVINLEVIRTVTDRQAGVVRFDCRLIA